MIIRVPEKQNRRRIPPTRTINLESRSRESLQNKRRRRRNHPLTIPWTWGRAEDSWNLAWRVRSLFCRIIAALIFQIRIMICRTSTTSLKVMSTIDPRKSHIREITTRVPRKADTETTNRALLTHQWKISCSRKTVDSNSIWIHCLPRTISSLFHPVKTKTWKSNPWKLYKNKFRMLMNQPR